MSTCIENNVCNDFSIGSYGESVYHDITGGSEVIDDPFSLQVI